MNYSCLKYIQNDFRYQHMKDLMKYYDANINNQAYITGVFNLMSGTTK